MDRRLNEKSLLAIRKGLIKGDFSPYQVVAACLEAIRKKEKTIKAFITVCQEEALKEAKKKANQLKKLSLKQRERLFQQKPLFGIPIAVKDNFCTKNIPTTAGAKLLEKFIPPYDATVVTKLKESGAIILGKTNMDAWAHGSSTETSDFFTTRNPHDPTRLPGGSSGGSAAAVAAHETIAAIGSETAGSIRQPASWCGVVGLKPTYGRVSRWGLIAMASSTDSPGPITKTVADAAFLLDILAGKDEKDATTVARKKESYFNQLNRLNPKKITLGIPREYLEGVDPQVKRVVQKAFSQLRKQGFRLKRVSLLDPRYAIAVYTVVQRAEVSSNLARFDGIRFGRERKFFGQEAKRRIMLGAWVLSSGYYDQYYLKAQKVRHLIIKDFNRVFRQVDLLVAPTSPVVALKIGVTKNEPMFGEKQDVLVEASSLAGLPGISLNCGWVRKLPVGIQFFGPQFSEKLILRVAFQAEKLFSGSQP